MDYLKLIIFVFTSHFLSKRARGHDGSLSVDNHAERSKDHFTQKEKKHTEVQFIYFKNKVQVNIYCRKTVSI